MNTPVKMGGKMGRRGTSAPPSGGGRHPPKWERSKEQAAKLMNVAPRSVDYADKVRKDGCVELKSAVMSNAIGLRMAAELSEKPKSVQKIAVEHGKKAVREVIAGKHKPEPDKPNPGEEAMKEHNRALESWARATTARYDSLPEGPWIGSDITGSVQQHLKSAANTARAAKGHNVCPKCKGGGCQTCKQTGFLDRQTYEVVVAQA